MSRYPGRRGCIQGLLGSLVLGCTRTAAPAVEVRPPELPPSSPPSPPSLPRPTAPSLDPPLYAAGFRFGPWVIGRYDVALRIDPDGPREPRDRLGLLAPSWRAVVEHRALLAQLGSIPLLEIAEPTFDLSPLTDLINVQGLVLGPRAQDLTPLQTLPALETLVLDEDAVVPDPTRFGRLSQVRYLRIRGYLGPRGPLKLDWLRAFPGLRSLSVVGTTGRAIDLAGLRWLKQLEQLQLSSFTLDDLSPLARQPLLTNVALLATSIRSFHGLAKRSLTTRPLALELTGSVFSAPELAKAAAQAPRVEVDIPASAPPPRPLSEWVLPDPASRLPGPLHEAGFREARVMPRKNLLLLDPKAWDRQFDAPVVVAPDTAFIEAHRALLARQPRIAALLIQSTTLDLQALLGLDNLAGLWIHCTDADLAPLRALPLLSRLYLHEGSIVCDPGRLGPIPQLRTLVIDGYVGPNGPTADLDWLKAPGLEHLELTGGTGRTLDLTALSSLTRLRSLELRDFRLEDLAPIGRMPQLEQLTLRAGEVVAFKGLAPLRARRFELKIDGTAYSEHDLVQSGAHELIRQRS